MKKHTLMIGLNHEKKLKQTIPTFIAKKIIIHILNNYNIDGLTIYNCKGCYKMNNGKKVNENTLKIEILDFDENLELKIKNAAKQIAFILDQESIAYECVETKSTLLYK